jgi:hypothetical protein
VGATPSLVLSDYHNKHKNYYFILFLRSQIYGYNRYCAGKRRKRGYDRPNNRARADKVAKEDWLHGVSGFGQIPSYRNRNHAGQAPASVGK